MPDSLNKIHKDSLPTTEEACLKVAKIYNSGTNQDKAVLQVLQEVFNLPPDYYDFNEFYSDKPDDTDQFLCKVLAAGTVSIYLDIITKSDIKPIPCKNGNSDATDRIAHIFNSLLNMCSDGNGINPVEFDPFQHDQELETLTIDDKLRKAYTARVSKLFATFIDKFGVSDCVDILGFDPFNYENYDEETQEKIESGEWMQKCVDCMQHIITAVKEESQIKKQ